MMRTFFKMSWRNAKKHRSFTLISLGSLILGITLFFLISVWAKDELSYDKVPGGQTSVFRVETNLVSTDGTTDVTPTVGWPVGKQLEKYPEVEAVTYLRNWRPIIKHQQTYFYEKALWADHRFFEVFGYGLAEGNAATALQNPYSLVISQSLKKKYFGQGDALGKSLELDDSVQYTITGVFKELPKKSHLSFEMIGSFATFCSKFPEDCAAEFASGWFDLNVYNYVKLRPTAIPAATESKIKNMVLEEGKEQVKTTGFKSTLSLRAIDEIYLYSNLPTAKGSVGNIKTVKLFGAIGLFILVIAALNFINLSTAKSVERAREIGVQKVLGNSRSRLILQFLSEAALLCFVAASISIFLSLLLLSPFNEFAGKNFTWSDLLSASNLLLLIIIILLLIPLAGFYPAWVLSAFKPMTVLKAGFSQKGSGAILRKTLVVSQFVISAGLIMATLIMWKQSQFMQQKHLGFDKENILVVTASNVPWVYLHEQSGRYKELLLQQAGIKNVTACAAIPGRSGWNGQFAYPEGRVKEEALSVEYIPVDANYLKTIGLQLKAGRDFLEGSKTDQDEAFIINESAVKYFGWGQADNAIGKKLSTSGKDGRVVGVVKDYHQHGLQQTISAVVLSPMHNASIFAIKYQGPAQQVIKQAESIWQQVYSGYPIEYRFLDEDFQLQYGKEQRLQHFMAIAAMLAIVIGCLGLLGLVMYTSQKRVKEIGVRKVLGASVTGIVQLLSFDLLKLVGVAVLITIPIAWWAMHKWLQQFAYRIEISWWIFLIAAAVALLVAMLTISVQAIRAALANPVKSLKSE